MSEVLEAEPPSNEQAQEEMTRMERARSVVLLLILATFYGANLLTNLLNPIFDLNRQMPQIRPCFQIRQELLQKGQLVFKYR